VTADLVSLLPKVSALAKRRVKHDHRTQTETAERSISSIPAHISCRLEWDAPCALALCWGAHTLQQCCEHSACRSPCSISTAAQRSRISVLRMIMHGLHLQARSELPKHAQRTAGVLVFCCAACALARVARRRRAKRAACARSARGAVRGPRAGGAERRQPWGRGQRSQQVPIGW
jgi:hypothetical protein